jgi:hypothetical protein
MSVVWNEHADWKGLLNDDDVGEVDSWAKENEMDKGGSST